MLPTHHLTHDRASEGGLMRPRGIGNGEAALTPIPPSRRGRGCARAGALPPISET